MSHRIRLRIRITAALLALAGLATASAQMQVQVFEADPIPARVWLAFNGADGENLRGPIKSALERYGGPLDIAMSDFSDEPLALVLVRLSGQRRVRLLLGRGGADPQAEEALCEALSPVLEVRFWEGLGHRFAVLGEDGVLLSSADWSSAALREEAQGIALLEGTEVAQRYRATFDGLWDHAQTSCKKG